MSQVWFPSLSGWNTSGGTQPSLPLQAHLAGLLQLSFEYLQRWRAHHPSGHLCEGVWPPSWCKMLLLVQVKALCPALPREAACTAQLTQLLQNFMCARSHSKTLEPAVFLSFALMSSMQQLYFLQLLESRKKTYSEEPWWKIVLLESAEVWGTDLSKMSIPICDCTLKLNAIFHDVKSSWVSLCTVPLCCWAGVVKRDTHYAGPSLCLAM